MIGSRLPAWGEPITRVLVEDMSRPYPRLHSPEYLAHVIIHRIANETPRRLTDRARATICLVLTVALPSLLSAQRRPGVPMGFYTTTGLVTGDLEIGSITSTTSRANTPRVALSGLVTAPLKRSAKRAWIAGVRVTPLELGNTSPCLRETGATGCQNGPFKERIALLAGGAFDIRSTILRTMVGTTLHQVGGQGARLGTTVRLDFASPQLRGPTPTVFYSATFLGSQSGQGTTVTSLGIGFRAVRRR